jgi:hypothetical protein
MKNGSVRDAALKDIAAIPGLVAEDVCRAGNHFKIRVATPSGVRTLVVSVTASDWRAALNNRAILRRWARGEA